MAEMLEVKNLVAKYGDFQALFGIDFAMAQGGIVALIGANGAGKSTFLKAIAGQMANQAGRNQIRGPRDRLALVRRNCRHGDCDGTGGAAAVPESYRRRESQGRRLLGQNGTLDARHGLCPVPGPERTPAECRDRAIGGPAADGRDRPRADVEPAPSPLR